MTNIDIIGVGNKVNPLPKKDDKSFCSLDEYLTIARKTIASYAPAIRLGLAEEMLGNEDAVANIAHAVMLADWVFDGRGNIHGFRKQRIKWAIKSYVGRSSKASSRRMLPLDNLISANSNGSSQETFASRVVDNSPRPDEIVSELELSEASAVHLNDLLTGGNISDQASEYIRLHYLESKSMADIASNRGVSRQSVHDLIKRAIRVLRQIADNDNFFRGIIDGD